jgi:integrase
MKSLLVKNVMREWQKRRAPVMTARTVATNRAVVDEICNLYGNYDVAKLTLNDVENLRNILLGVGRAKVTVARYLSTLRAGLGDAGEHLKIGKLISELKRGPTKVECWTKEEAKKIRETARGIASHSLWYYVQFLFKTGMRRGELLALHWNDIDNERNRIHIHRSLALDGSIQNGTKWGGERWFPMGSLHRTLVEMAQAHLAHGNEVIFELLDQRTVGRNFNRIVKHAGVPQYKMHCTRHSAISWALSAGMSLRKASEIFGVSQLTLERHYAHYVEENVDMSWAEL